ncbi:unnamed protein product [Polarella glacialis]|uniref:Uncharacterized protein n=1 Tax=Polarella glacialis TaxID=89957 RepID=A0A813L0Q9_POLGL|nr:unnamed protein product [Polarella glacialis]CAE8720139.1 unnamed protein product [Polarella glacialis]
MNQRGLFGQACRARVNIACWQRVAFAALVLLAPVCQAARFSSNPIDAAPNGRSEVGDFSERGERGTKHDGFVEKVDEVKVEKVSSWSTWSILQNIEDSATHTLDGLTQGQTALCAADARGHRVGRSRNCRCGWMERCHPRYTILEDAAWSASTERAEATFADQGMCGADERSALLLTLILPVALLGCLIVARIRQNSQKLPSRADKLTINAFCNPSAAGAARQSAVFRTPEGANWLLESAC